MSDNESESSPPVPPHADRALVAADLNGGYDDEVFGGNDVSTHDGTETDISAADDEPDEEAEEEKDGLDGAAVSSIEKSVNDSVPEEEEDEGNGLKLLLCCCGSFLCVALMVLLYFMLKRDDIGVARAQLDPSTNAPTFIIETDSPTPLTTVAPTVFQTGITIEPTAGPTPSPTLPPISLSGEKSRLNCAEINLAAAEAPGENLGDGNFLPVETLTDGTQVCGDTFGGVDPEKPNRNRWSVRIGRRDCPYYTYDEGFEVCDTVGARWCTVDEFIADLAQGTGCGGDSEFVYTNTDCFDTDAGLPGKVMFDVGLRASRIPFFFCESDLTRGSLARCCGDAVL